MSTSLFPPRTPGRVDSTSKKTSEPVPISLVENALQNVHKHLSPTASQADFHRELMAKLESAAVASNDAAVQSIETDSSLDYLFDDTQNKEVSHPDKAAAQCNKAAPTTHKAKDNATVQRIAHGSMSEKPKIIKKRVKPGPSIFSNRRMGVRGDAPINKKPLQKVAHYPQPTTVSAAPVDDPATAKLKADLAAKAKARRETTIDDNCAKYVDLKDYGRWDPNSAKRAAAARRAAALAEAAALPIDRISAQRTQYKAASGVKRKSDGDHRDVVKKAMRR